MQIQGRRESVEVIAILPRIGYNPRYIQGNMSRL